MKMQEKKLKRFNVYSKIANGLFIFTLIAGSLLFLVLLGAAIYLAASGYDLIGLVDEILYKLAPEIMLSFPDGFHIPYAMLFVVIFQIALAIALTAYIVKSIANMFKNIAKNKTPFNPRTLKSLKSMGIALLVYAGILFVISILSGTVIPHPAAMTFNTNIDYTSIFFGILILALAEIFEFGMNLQQDNESIV